MPIPGDFHSSGIRGIGDWHFFIPRGSGNVEPIPQGPRKFSGNWITLNEPSLVINMTHNEDKA